MEFFCKVSYTNVYGTFLKLLGDMGIMLENKNLTIEDLEPVEIKSTHYSEDRQKEELYLYNLRHLAYANAKNKIDSLTNLPGLGTFFFLADEMIMNNPEHKYGLVIMDITQFKAVNEFCGREAGDNLLRAIADHLISLTESRPLTMACHIRADVFCFCTAFEEKKELSSLAMDLGKTIKENLTLYRVHPSFGICATEEKMPVASLMKDRAAIALSYIKGKFYSDYKFFDESMSQKLLKDRMIENEISTAIDNGEIVPFIQPKVDMSTGKIIGGEALVRWVSKDRGIIPPGEFIPTLEANGFIVTLDKLVWRQVFAYQRKRMDEGLELVPISINISRAHVYDEDLIETLTGYRDEYGVDAKYVWLELTESAMVDKVESIFSKMKTLQEEGFLISMDDFGTGFSSLIMLKIQPVDEVKMDREFIIDLENENSIIILKNVANMLKALGKKIIVEGIETHEQKQVLLDLGLNIGQGFFFYRPMPIEEFDKTLNLDQSK